MKYEKTYVGAAVFFDRMYNDGFTDGDDALPARTDKSGSELPLLSQQENKGSLPSLLLQFMSWISERL